MSSTWQKANPEKYKHSQRAAHLKRNFNLSVEAYDAILLSQGGHCALCEQTPEADGRRLCVDHDHKTNIIRGLLCLGCNKAIAKLGDNETGLLRALTYVRRT